MRQEENIVGIEMSPNTFIKGCKTSIKDIELVAHSDLNIDYNLNKHEYMTGQVVWGFPKEVLCDNQDELEQEEFGYSVIKDIDTATVGEKTAMIWFKGKICRVDYTIVEG